MAIVPVRGSRLYLAYDLTHYADFTVDASGNLSLALTGGTTVTIAPAVTLSASLRVGTTMGLGGAATTNTKLAMTGTLASPGTEAYGIRFNHTLQLGAGSGLISQIYLNSGTAHAGGFGAQEVRGMSLDLNAMTFTTGGGAGAFGATKALYLKAATAGAVNHALYVDSGLSYFGGNVSIGAGNPASYSSVVAVLGTTGAADGYSAYSGTHAAVFKSDRAGTQNNTEFILQANATEAMRILTGGGVKFVSGGSIGFYGTTPIAKQTGVAVSTAGIHAALVNLGLIAA